MLKIAICDDEKIVVEEIEKILETFIINSEYEAEYMSFTSEKELLSLIISGQQFDLILLDIELGENSGIDFAKYLRNELNIYKTKIVFITAKESYMKDTFLCDALRFITKPIQKEKLYEAINYVIKSHTKENEVFVLKENDETKLIPYDEIIYLISKHRKVEIIGKYLTTECKLQLCDIEKNFIDNKFIKISRTVMVNRIYIEKIKANKVILNNGKELDMSKRMKQDVIKWLERK